LPPSSDQLYYNYGAELNKIKSISDEVVYHPVKYKPLFGPKADEALQATFKIVKNPDVVVNDNDVKTRVINAINQFFALDNWEFGEAFYFTELATYIMNSLTPDIVNVVIVPKSDNQAFGSLFEIKAESDEIFISSATVADVEIIDAITASKIKATGNVVSSSVTPNAGVQSSTLSSSTQSGGGYSFGSSSSSSGSGSSNSGSSGSSGSSGGGYSY
jgi:uncharacterized membrane protein YgcG